MMLTITIQEAFAAFVLLTWLASAWLIFSQMMKIAKLKTMLSHYESELDDSIDRESNLLKTLVDIELRNIPSGKDKEAPPDHSATTP